MGGSGGKRECFRCGSQAHMADSCPFKGSKCFGCGRIGHTWRKCRARKEGEDRKSDWRSDGRKADVKVVEEASGSECTGSTGETGGLDVLSLYPLGARTKHDPVFVEVKIRW